MFVTVLLGRLAERPRHVSRDEARQTLLKLAESYQSTQPSYAADLRAAALHH